MRNRLEKMRRIKDAMTGFNYRTGFKRLIIFASFVAAVVTFAYTLNVYGSMEKAFLAAMGTLVLIGIFFWMIKWVISGFTQNTHGEKI